MAFNSLIFLIFFAVVLALHSLPLSWKFKKTNLLLASYIFYAAWNPPFVILLWISTATDWFAAKRMQGSEGAKRRMFLLLSILVNLGLLGYFKYGHFLEENFARLMAAFGVDYPVAAGSIILPLGISFYTFQSMSYSFDVYRKHIKPADSALDFALYVSFFPQLVAGPILRAGFFLEQLIEDNRERVADIGWGCALITVGLFEKVVLADGLLAPVVEAVYADTTAATTTDAWVGTLAFAGQIFFDFNGYSVIAVGLARCMGFRLPWNFLSPYAAVGFSDFWRRWHVTLSAWLRDYLYISLGGNRKGKLRTYANLMITMLLGGLWHGASWLFVLWGGAHGLLLVLERGARRLFGNVRFFHAGAGKVLVGLLTFTLVCLTWVLFRAETVDNALNLFGVMLVPAAGLGVTSLAQVLTVVGVIAALLGTHWFMRNREFGAVLRNLPWPAIGMILAAMLVAILLSPGEERDFIYFEF
ncbi:MAG: MBOAT family O-acyltransferase [Woeseiaceae bacterium]|nr:MBOAT family O-acyltransferase [Woeseiaceae bacterium]